MSFVRNVVLYVGSFRFPEGDAAAARVLGIGKTLRDLGYEVIFGGGEPRGRTEDQGSDGTYEYQGFRYHSTGDLRSICLTPVQRLLNFLDYGGRTLQWLDSMPTDRVAAVVVYNGASLFVHRLRKWCREKRIHLIVDCTEWYDPAHLVGGQFGLVRWDNEMRMRYVNGRVGNIIAISKYLESYYSNKGCRVVRIPPLVDLQDVKWKVNVPTRRYDGLVRLVYAGSPARKDLIGNVMLAMVEMYRIGMPVHLDLLGPTQEELKSVMAPHGSSLDSFDKTISCRGRISQSAVPQFLAQADFSVLLRPTARYAQAGFPTKVVESLAAGVPVITNLTSDLGLYLRDEKEGIALTGSSPEALVDGIKRIHGMPADKWQMMRQYAIERAAMSFDYRNYAGLVGDFIRNRLA